MFFEETFERWSGIEMIFDGILSFAGDDDDVLDAGGDALFRDVLNLRLINYGEHFFGLRFGGGKKTRAESGGGEDGLANFVARGPGAIDGRGFRRGGHVVRHRLRNSRVFNGLKLLFDAD